MHLGLGAFHRAHQAHYTEDANPLAGSDWQIEAVAMRNPALAQALAAQNYRFTLVEQASNAPRTHTIDVIKKAYVLPHDPMRVVRRMADPDVHIVTLTVTEKGYGADLNARSLDRSDPKIQHDTAEPSGVPQSLPGLLAAGLDARRTAGGSGMSLLSCDNLPDNGGLLRRLVTEMARSWSTDLARWVETTCCFPSCTVDRITPAPDTALLEATGDPVAVATEPFRQWVIEDNFAGPRPDWEHAGALFVPDVAPFEMMKLRMLNGAHSLLAYLGCLADIPAIRDTMSNSGLRALAIRHMNGVARTLPELPGISTDEYAQDLIDRFANKAIDHRCLQIAMDGSQKMPQRILNPASDLIAMGADFDTCALAFAAWVRFAEGKSDGGAVLDMNDPKRDEIKAALAQAAPNPGAKIAAVFDAAQLVSPGPEFEGRAADFLNQLDKSGAVGTVAARVGT